MQSFVLEIVCRKCRNDMHLLCTSKTAHAENNIVKVHCTCEKCGARLYYEHNQTFRKKHRELPDNLKEHFHGT